MDKKEFEEQKRIWEVMFRDLSERVRELEIKLNVGKDGKKMQEV